MPPVVPLRVFLTVSVTVTDCVPAVTSVTLKPRMPRLAAVTPQWVVAVGAGVVRGGAASGVAAGAGVEEVPVAGVTAVVPGAGRGASATVTVTRVWLVVTLLRPAVRLGLPSLSTLTAY